MSMSLLCFLASSGVWLQRSGCCQSQNSGTNYTTADIVVWMWFHPRPALAVRCVLYQKNARVGCVVADTSSHVLVVGEPIRAQGVPLQRVMYTPTSKKGYNCCLNFKTQIQRDGAKRSRSSSVCPDDQQHPKSLPRARDPACTRQLKNQ